MRILKARMVSKLMFHNFCHHLHYQGELTPDNSRFPAAIGGWRCRYCKHFNGIISNDKYLYVKCSYKDNSNKII